MGQFRGISSLERIQTFRPLETGWSMAKRECLLSLIAGGLVLIAPLFEVPAAAQAIGFQPIPAPLPSGVQLNVTPSVSADRRYVRIGVNAGFQTIEGFSTFSVPAAVSGGGAGMNGLLGFGGGGAGGGAGAGGGGGAGGRAGAGGLMGGLAANGNGANGTTANGAIGMSGFPYAWAVSGGYGPLTGWGGTGWTGPGMMSGYGGGAFVNGFNGMNGVDGFNGLNGMNQGILPGFNGPGMGQPLTNTDFPGAGGAGAGAGSADPFQQARDQGGAPGFRGQGFDQQDRNGNFNGNAPRARSSRTRSRAPRRTVTPRRAQTARAKEASKVPPAVKNAVPDTDDSRSFEQPLPR
jgi:hypothetical protein